MAEGARRAGPPAGEPSESRTERLAARRAPAGGADASRTEQFAARRAPAGGADASRTERLAARRAPAGGADLSGTERLAAATSRRGFLARVSGAVMALAGARTVGALVEPGEAEAFHFCGHIYTTDSCPHPTGLPRIDRRGLPLRARDGHPVDDLGRLVDRQGQPVGEDGELLRDPDGRPLPPATRTKVCAAVGEEYGFPTQIDGAWYRCCGGQVRKLVDCCADHPRRINGDRALRGYCYRGRKVFCVMYYDTHVPC